jgi:hypothetical protein
VLQRRLGGRADSPARRLETTMRTLLLVTALVAVVPPLFAQDKKPPADAPTSTSEPKTKAHEALAMFVGEWDTSMQAKAMPGVPGMEKDQTVTGYQHAELICNGLFLMQTIDSSPGGVPFQGVFLIGYDQVARHYTGHWVNSMDCAPTIMTGEYDAAKKLWRWSGTTPQGRLRTELAMQADGGSIETGWMVGADGKETQCSTVTRTRRKGGAAAHEASAPQDPKLSAEHKLLQQDVGDWTAAVTINMGGPAIKSAATERVRSICGGHWTWTDYRGEIMGTAFEAHALTGYDPAKKEYVGFWFDGAAVSATRGSFDAAGKVRTMIGASADPSGKPMQMTKVMTHNGADSRTLHTEFAGNGRAGTMEVAYTRKAK